MRLNTRKMTITVIMLFAILIGAVAVTAQENVRHAPREQELIDLSDAKWKWMSEKDVEQLDSLFHDSAQFVHMGGYWGKEAELNTIKAGAIWYKHAEIHKQEVQFAGPTATVYSTIHLNSVVGGREVRFPFYVTETYLREGGKWKLLSLVFTKTLGE